MFSDLFNSPIPSIHPNPLFLYQRLGYVFILASFFWYYELKRQTKHSFVIDISRESLPIYWLHLEIIYSKIWNGRNLEQLAAGSFTLIECFAGTLLLIFLMILTAKLWGGFKKKYPEYPKTITSTVIILTIIVCITR